MNHNEFKKLIEIISSNYPKDFQLEEYQLNYWFNELKKYPLEDILKRLDSHLKGEYAYMPPKLTFLTKNVKTEDQKLEKIFVLCPVCNTRFEYPLQKEVYQNCLERCNSIEYIKKKSIEIGIDPRIFFKSNPKTMKQNDFEIAYNNFLKEILENHKNKISVSEQKILTKMFSNYEEQININEITSQITGR